MSELQGKFRHRRTNFAAVSNEALQDSGLSLKAKGLYAVIQSYINIPNYDLYKGYLMKICQEGVRAFDASWKELKDHGYLKLYRMPGKKCGRFVYEYELLDVADISSPSTINLNSQGEPVEPVEPGNPDSGKSGYAPSQNASKDKSDHTLQNVPYGQNACETARNRADHTLHFAPGAPCTTCSKHPVLKAPDAKRGYLNKNEINKTEIKKNNGNNPLSVSQSSGNAAGQEDGQTDELREKLKEQIDYAFFAENYPEDLSGVDALLDCMAETLAMRTTRVNGVNQSREALERYIDRVDSEDIRGFLEHMRGKPMRNIRNINAYWRSAFINFLREQKLSLLTV